MSVWVMTLHSGCFHTHRSDFMCGSVCVCVCVYLAASRCCVCRLELFAGWSRGSLRSWTSRKRWSANLESSLRCSAETGRLGPDYIGTHTHTTRWLVTELGRQTDTISTAEYTLQYRVHMLQLFPLQVRKWYSLLSLLLSQLLCLLLQNAHTQTN